MGLLWSLLPSSLIFKLLGGMSGVCAALNGELGGVVVWLFSIFTCCLGFGITGGLFNILCPSLCSGDPLLSAMLSNHLVHRDSQCRLVYFYK